LNHKTSGKKYQQILPLNKAKELDCDSDSEVDLENDDDFEPREPRKPRELLNRHQSSDIDSVSDNDEVSFNKQSENQKGSSIVSSECENADLSCDEFSDSGNEMDHCGNDIASDETSSLDSDLGSGEEGSKRTNIEIKREKEGGAMGQLTKAIFLEDHLSESLEGNVRPLSSGLSSKGHDLLAAQHAVKKHNSKLTLKLYDALLKYGRTFHPKYSTR
jgi:hypothetical protein